MLDTTDYGLHDRRRAVDQLDYVLIAGPNARLHTMAVEDDDVNVLIGVIPHAPRELLLKSASRARSINFQYGLVYSGSLVIR